MAVTWDGVWREAGDAPGAERKAGEIPRLVAALVVLVAPVVAYGIWLGLPTGMLGDERWVSFAPFDDPWQQAILGYSAVLLLAACALLAAAGVKPADLGFRRSNVLPALGVGALLFLATGMQYHFWVHALGRPFGFTVLLVALLVAAAGETFFRAYLIGALRRAGLGMWAAVAVAAVLYAAAFLAIGPYEALRRLATGALMGIAFAARGSLPELVGASALMEVLRMVTMV